MTRKSTMTELTWRERAAVRVLLFILQMLNPTGYEHEVKELRRDLLERRHD